MILIFSRHADPSTIPVLSWISARGGNYIRIDLDKDIASLKRISLDGEIIMNINEKEVRLDKVSSVWYWRGGIPIFIPTFNLNKVEDIFKEDKKLYEEVKWRLQEEYNTIKDYIYEKIENKPSIGKRTKNSLNKLKVLSLAKKVGLSIPDSFIVTSKEDLISIIFLYLILLKPSI